MSEDKIENLQELITQYVGPDKVITESQIRRLTAPGENYFSTMLDVNLTLEHRKTKKEEKLHAVAKCMLPPNGNMPGPGDFTYGNEVRFYKDILPILENFRKEEGAKRSLDIFPELYAYRPNIHGENDTVDEHAVIMVENLKTKGYSNIDRSVGFDLDCAKIILKDLANFHSTFLALSLKKPEIFKDKILSNIKSPGPPPDGLPPRNDSAGPPPDGHRPDGPPPHGHRPDGPPPHGPPPRGPPPHGPPPHGPPPHGPPPHGPPPHGPPRHGPPPHGSPPHGSPQHGPPPHGPPPHGPPRHGPPPHGPPPHGPPPHGHRADGPPSHDHRADGPPSHGSPSQNRPRGPPGLPNVIYEIIEPKEHLKKYIPKLKELKPFPMGSKEVTPDKPFRTIVHNDMWVNNTMQTFDSKGKMLKNKFVDFQMYSYDTPVRDVIFFIWSSVQLEVVKNNFDKLLRYYYDNFIENLKELHCDVSPYSYEKFMEEVKEAAPVELAHTLMMSMVIFGKKGVAAVDTSAGPPGPDMFKLEDATQAAKDRIIGSIEYFGKNGWL